MARSFLVPINMVQNELQNAAIQNLATAPTVPAPVKGQIYYNTTDNTLYWWDGGQWIAAKAAAGATPSNTVVDIAAGGTGVGGASTNFSRGDHVHGLPVGAVTAETAFGQASANGVATTVARSDHTHGTPAHNAAAHSTIPISSFAAAIADINMGGFKVTNVGAPTSPTDAANKQYVDDTINGLSWKDSCRIASNANLTLTGTGGVIDGVVVSAGDRVLVKNQTTTNQNGIYVAAAGAWARSADTDSVGELDGGATFVSEGATQADTAWIVTTNGPITPGTTNVGWAQFGAGAAYVAGAGLTLTGTTFDVVAANGSITVAADNIAVAYAGTGSAVTAARSDHTHTGMTTKFAADVGGSTSVAITHNLGTLDVQAQLYDKATGATVDSDMTRTNTNTVTFGFAVAPAAATYRAVIVG